MQGVGFRWYVYDVAVSFRLSGWVRNLYDGKVEAVFEGEKASIEEAIRQCAEGPRSAAVSGMDVNWDEKLEDLAGFDIRY